MRVICRTKPEWGLGQVLSDDGRAKVTAFFLSGGKRVLDTTIAELDLVTGTAASNPILDVAAQANWQHAHHNLYVIELKPEVFTLETIVSSSKRTSATCQVCFPASMSA